MKSEVLGSYVYFSNMCNEIGGFVRNQMCPGSVMRCLPGKP